MKTTKAMETKKLLRKTAFELMDKYGYENVTIQMICNKCNVSVGTFYNYFKSKDEISEMATKENDEWFETTVKSQLTTEDPEEYLRMFFMYYAEMNENLGTDLYNRTYGAKKRDIRVEASRPMHVMLEDFIHKSQSEGTIISTMRSNEISRWLFTLVRGVVLDWCTENGNYNLKREVDQLLDIVLPYFLKK